MRLAICRIPSFTFIAFFCADLIHGARPGRDITDGGHALEVNHEDGRQDGRQAEANHEDSSFAEVKHEDGHEVNHEVSIGSVVDANGCPKLKEQLQALGFRGEGDPCEWGGIICGSPCTATWINVVRSGQTPSGDIAVLRDMTELRNLVLSSAQLTGDLGELRNLEHLETLRLDGTKVTGDLQAVQNLTELKALSLYKTDIAGDISAVRSLERLMEVALHDTRVTGDVVAFSKARHLEHLRLGGTGVAGDVASLQRLTNLRSLQLQNTRVEGDLAVVQNMKKLERLNLANSRVTGDVLAVRDLTEIEVLVLSKTSVDGDIASVQKLAYLVELHLAGTKVKGEISAVVQLKDLELLDLAGTAVSGWITGDSWNGCCKNLREINVAAAAIGPLPVLEGDLEFSTDEPLLPALQTLNASGSNLNASVKDFLLPLAQTPLTAIAARGCGLSGAMPDLRSVSFRNQFGWLESNVSTKLAKSLQVLDLSDNNLSSTGPSLPAAVRVILRRNQIPLTLHRSVLQQAVKRSVDLWLEGTPVANPDALKPLLSHELRLQPEFRNQRSFACRDLVEPKVQITPHVFMPDVMCHCNPGYAGSGIACSPCPNNTYAAARNMAECLKCPVNSSSPSAATSWQLCQCAFGSVREDQSHKQLSCQCPANEALVDTWTGLEHCEPCHKLRLKCPSPGSNASTAQVEDGFIRLRPNSHETFRCLDKSRCKDSTCVAGYKGVLCSDCADGNRSSNGQCKACADVQDMSAKHKATLALCCAGMLVVLVAAWTHRRRFGNIKLGLPWKCAAKLLLPQLAILLQVMQLWSVLGRLAQVPKDFSKGNTTEVESTKGDGLVAYMEALQLTSTELQGFFALQCIFHGASVRLASAIATPLAPLILLLTCCFIEVFSRGSGIQVGLKVLAVLFIGGAAGTAQLMSCQGTDGTGEAALHDLSFRPLVPHLLCTDAPWVNWIGRGCAVFYGVLIPCFLAFLFAKQHVVMKQSKTFMVSAEGGPEKVTLQLHMLSDKECTQDDIKRKRLIAAAAAYVAVHVKRRALVSLKDADAAMVQVKEDGENAGDDFEAGFSVDDMVQSEDAAQLRRERTEMLRYNAIVHMLAERSVLAEIQLKRSDRIMAGATELLCKYVNCGFVWLEVCLKLASAALVSVVDSKDGFWLSVAITLGMALVVGLAQPFMQPQLNALQTCCFVCLSMAAVGFHVRDVWWLSRVALALPVLLLALLLLRPDSKEAVALRLQEELEKQLLEGPAEVSSEQELEKKLPEGPVEVSAEQVRFI